MRFWVLVLGVFVITACQPEETKACAQIDNQSPNVVLIQKSDCDTVEFTAELALSPQEKMQGLMNRTSLPANASMLFIFNEEQERGFWMKNTLIPLDMLFIKKDGRIHHIHSNAKPHDLTSVKSNGPVIAVMEINGGMADKLGIKPGDMINHPFFSSAQAQ